jgi:hypothetical protein
MVKSSATIAPKGFIVILVQIDGKCHFLLPQHELNVIFLGSSGMSSRRSAPSRFVIRYYRQRTNCKGDSDACQIRGKPREPPGAAGANRRLTIEEVRIMKANARRQASGDKKKAAGISLHDSAVGHSAICGSLK